MKKVSLILSAVLMTAMMVTSFGGDALSKVSSSNEASSFEEVTIGNQIWMAENLNVDKFRNGDPIPHAKTAEEWKRAGENGEPAWCYYDNDPSNGEKYGKLYNWYAVNDARGLAPNGYHIPTDAEWTQLSDYLGGKSEAGTKMKSTSGWNNNNNNDGPGTNISGFTGLPGGNRGLNGTFVLVGNVGSWWSSTELVTYSAWYRNLLYDYGVVGRPYGNKGNGVSVRCLRD